jgi:osmotically-inducible protein OsmY
MKQPMNNQLKLRRGIEKSRDLQWNEHSNDRRQRQGPHRGKGPKGYHRSDERIKEEVNQSLSDDPQLDASSIEVSVHGGDVLLVGTVSTREDKRRAEDCIDDISGVNNVENRIKVETTHASA